jgi:endonuclease/exonuclease/phosphatase family metal-dependent hydrolase
MRIVSLNAWGGAVFDELVHWLPACDADVICLQEVTRTPGSSGWTRFEDGERTLPQRANLFDDVRAVLPAHQAFFLTSDAGPVVANDGQRRRQDFGLAVFVHERLPVIGQASTYIHGGFVDHDEWSIADRPRIAQAIRLVDREGGRVVTVVHLHGLRDPAGKDDTPARRAQAQRLASLVTQIRGSEDLTVVCGDFNVTPTSTTFDVLATSGLTDLVGTASTRTSLYPKDLRHANYLLVSDVGAVKQFRVLDEPVVSDHCALVLDII